MVAAVLAAALLAVGVSGPAAAAGKDDGPKISAPHAILIAENGSVLYEREPDALIHPASLAKLMTAEYVFHQLKEGKIKLTDEYRGQRIRLAPRRRAVAQLHHVRQAATAGSASTICCTA